MQAIHLPAVGPRYWAALCLASIFGANTGDFFARNMGLGHIAGLPFLAVALAVVIVAERFDRTQHQWYYWIAIIIVRTAVGDFVSGRNMLGLPLSTVVTGVLFVALLVVWRETDRPKRLVPIN
jgi:uncharacterized membrane-anchored protein